MILAELESCFEIVKVTDSTRWLPLRYLRIVAKLIRASKKDFDIAFVGFLGQPLMLLMRKLTAKPIVFDAFLSVYDTLCFDRMVISPHSLAGKIAFWLDQTSCDRANKICLDTQAHAAYFQDTFSVPQDKIESLFVGCDERVFYPRSDQNSIPLVLYYGSYLPLQGIDTIVRAAKQLENIPDLRFRIIGVGIETSRIRKLVSDLRVTNIEFLPPVPLHTLPEQIRQAMICLGGHFGASEKASRVIAGKTFQFLAMGKPTIVGDNLANRELLTHGTDAWFCKMADPDALASSILTLWRDPGLRQQLGQNARNTFVQKASLQALTPKLRLIVEQLASF
jgi:glycosyltransferase involved in cell wall biosynthesis